MIVFQLFSIQVSSQGFRKFIGDLFLSFCTPELHPIFRRLRFFFRFASLFTKLIEIDDFRHGIVHFKPLSANIMFRP